MRTTARLAAAMCLVAASPSTATPGLFDLGGLPEPNQLSFESEANDVSADGSVVVGRAMSRRQGSSSTRDQAFRVDGGVMRGLRSLLPNHNTSYARGVSDDGSVVVGAIDRDVLGGSEAFVWNGPSQLSILPALPGGLEASGAAGVNGDGSTVVGSDTDSLVHHGVRWDAGTPLVLDAGAEDSFANAVDAEGLTVVGVRGGVPMRWDGVVGQPLPIPPGMSEAQPLGISSDGGVSVGFSRTTPGTEQATLWTASGAILLGVLPGDTSSTLHDATADGSVAVGYSRNAATGVKRAVVWDAVNGMRSLQDLLVNEYGFDLTGWTLEEARGISDDGLVIVGSGKTYHLRRAWIAILEGGGTPACLNGADDDGDGVADMSDPGCHSQLDVSERSHQNNCDDGLDNDADGTVDYPADPGCASLETAENPKCDDELDNERDGRIDWDGGLAGGVPDPQCVGDPTGTTEGFTPCGLGFEAGAALVVLAALRARRRASQRPGRSSG